MSFKRANTPPSLPGFDSDFADTAVLDEPENEGESVEPEEFARHSDPDDSREPRRATAEPTALGGRRFSRTASDLFGGLAEGLSENTDANRTGGFVERIKNWNPGRRTGDRPHGYANRVAKKRRDARSLFDDIPARTPQAEPIEHQDTPSVKPLPAAVESEFLNDDSPANRR